jgi:hypothetical protein
MVDQGNEHSRRRLASSFKFNNLRGTPSPYAPGFTQMKNHPAGGLMLLKICETEGDGGARPSWPVEMEVLAVWIRPKAKS